MAHHKIKTLGELTQELELRNSHKRVVLCHGVFDLVHPGHRAHLKAAKGQGDILVVTVTPDRYVNKGPGRPAFGVELRAEGIADLEYVDLVAINEWPTAVETIKLLRPDVYCKGNDYADPAVDVTGEITNEEEAIKSVGGRLHLTNEITFSSTELINRYFSPYSEEVREFLEAFRQKFSAADIIKLLKQLETLKVMIVGDTIIDEYCYCLPEGTSPKRGIATQRYLRSERFAGGAVITANHVAQFCKEVTLVTSFNRNSLHFIKSNLSPNVQLEVFITSAPTVVKRRFIDDSSRNTLFYLCYIDEGLMHHHRKLAKYLDYWNGQYDLVIVNDFGHGFLEGNETETFKKARFLSLNVQTNSLNWGFNLFNQKYFTPDFLCQNELEIRLAFQEKIKQLPAILEDMKDLGYKRIAITRGRHGSVTYDGVLHEIPTLSREAVDATGAGDAYLAISSLCAAAGLPMDLVGFIGNAAGALHAGTVGNRAPVDRVALFKFTQTLLK